MITLQGKQILLLRHKRRPDQMYNSFQLDSG